jgi:hypothetical protein
MNLFVVRGSLIVAKAIYNEPRTTNYEQIYELSQMQCGFS